MRVLRGASVCVALLLVAFAAEVRADTITLYDVDFNSDTVGSTPTTGSGAPTRTGPSGISSFSEGGSATVVSGYGALADQPLQLRAVDTGTNPTQLGGGNIYFSLTSPGFTGFDRYNFEADLLLTDLTGSSGGGAFFDFFFHAIRFETNGDIDAVYYEGGSVHQSNIGTFSPGELFRVGLEVDMAQSEWAISLDGTEVLRNSLELVALTQFRIGHTSHSTSPTDFYIDNVLVTGSTGVAPIPEPSSLALLAAAGGILLLIRRRATDRRD